MDAQASQGSFHLPSSMEDFSPSSTTMDVTSQGSGAESDISQVLVEVRGMYEEGEGEVGE